ncbi:hypothetical protein C5B85_15045 [Pseudoclavibacter sp. AY1F1]|uniref:DUF4229 domain-containing protein n=1 Tax=Pseudoclavibacter sp. AY1F1 TaxID=2080583 RepID=UPI000CE71DF8|nr:DUF4229 domain-containing protein [Pseudoclavibacter sp. AY1F1]PPF42888.1 hypothetical protein C5B85_15045 [Pseudoclavibacter sp. AY1F1]
MNSKRAWLVYTVIRLLAFAVPFAVVMLALPAWQWNWLAGAAVGAIISACISVIFLRGTRQQMGADLQRLSERKDSRTADDKDEDAALDSSEDATLDSSEKTTAEEPSAEADSSEAELTEAEPPAKPSDEPSADAAPSAPQR